MKVCSRCENQKEITEFRKRGGTRKGHASWCKACHLEYDREYYNTNVTRKQNVKERRREHKRTLQRFLLEYWKTHPCVECGINDPRVLEFDHVDSTQKVNNIATMVRDGVLLETLKAEMVKCEVRCANCHRIRTAKQFNWFTNDP